MLVFTSFNVSFTQEQEVDSTEVQVNRKGKVVEKSGDELYFGITPGYSFRSLEENPSLFGKPLGERENEFGGWFYSFHLGYRTNLHKFVVLDIGFDFSRNGEFYETSGDSVYSYKNTYNYIGIPLKIGFQYGDKLKLHVAGGFVPKMFLNQTKLETVETEFGGTVTTSATVAGISISISDMPEITTVGRSRSASETPARSDQVRACPWM